MCCKLAFRNVRRSLKDYFVYFLTLTFGVCIFYVFGSMDAQQAMDSPVQSSIFAMLIQIMDVLSVFVSIVLGFLVLYANSFLIKRRKKELGVYALLGMPKGKVNLIFLLETAVVGALSLACGLGLGVAASQAVSLLTAQVFEVKLDTFHFVFSPVAAGKTILYFAIIFVVVMALGSVSISRQKLIDLLSAQKKNQRFRAKKLWHAVVLFLLSVALIGTAYGMFIKNGMRVLGNEIPVIMAIGGVGTLLFFMSLSGFLLRICKSNRRLYYNKLNMFVLRQLNSKINTTYLSVTFICLMLLLAVGALSFGIGVADSMQSELEVCTRYDVSLYNGSANDSGRPVLELLGEHGYDLDDYLERSVSFAYHDTGIRKSDLLAGCYEGEDIPGVNVTIDAVSQSDYNALMELSGQPTVDLSQGEYGVVALSGDAQKAVKRYLATERSLTLAGETLTAYRGGYLTGSLETSTGTGASGDVVFVLPDRVAAAIPSIRGTVSGFYAGDKEETEKEFFAFINQVGGEIEAGSEVRIYGATAEMVYQIALGSKVTFLYIGIYLGIVFLLASAAILALQQLSEAADNNQRYRLLRKLGTDDGMVRGAVFSQVALYFFIPLALALVHSAVFFYVMQDALTSLGVQNIWPSTLWTLGIVLAIYGAYFVLTYFGARRMATETSLATK